jgi:hypothetical protein
MGSLEIAEPKSSGGADCRALAELKHSRVKFVLAEH